MWILGLHFSSSTLSYFVLGYNIAAKVNKTIFTTGSAVRVVRFGKDAQRQLSQVKTKSTKSLKVSNHLS